MTAGKGSACSSVLQPSREPPNCTLSDTEAQQVLAVPASLELFPFTGSEPETWARRGKFKISRLRVLTGRDGVLLAGSAGTHRDGARRVTSGLNGALAIKHDERPELLGTRPKATFVNVSRKHCACCVRYLGPSFLCTQLLPVALFHQLDESSCLADGNAVAYHPSSLDFTSFERGLHRANIPSLCPRAEINLFHSHCHKAQTHAAQRLHYTLFLHTLPCFST